MHESLLVGSNRTGVQGALRLEGTQERYLDRTQGIKSPSRNYFDFAAAKRRTKQYWRKRQNTKPNWNEEKLGILGNFLTQMCNPVVTARIRVNQTSTNSRRTSFISPCRPGAFCSASIFSSARYIDS